MLLGKLDSKTRRVWRILYLAVKRFLQIDGAQWAGAFAYYAFYSLFPMILLFVTISSVFVDRDRATQEVISHLESYVPIGGEMQRHIVDAIAGVVKARRQAGALAFLMLVWVALQSFTTLICATNRAWGCAVYNWWRLPLRSLGLLGITVGAVFLGLTAPMLARVARVWFLPEHDFRLWLYDLANFLIPLLLVFFSLSLFYRLAPRRPTRFAEVWSAALCATILLRAAGSLFVIYLRDYATLNAVYGAFGGIMALLLWVYLSGCIFIFGACLCASQAEALAHTREAPPK